MGMLGWAADLSLSEPLSYEAPDHQWLQIRAAGTVNWAGGARVRQAKALHEAGIKGSGRQPRAARRPPSHTFREPSPADPDVLSLFWSVSWNLH